MDNFFVRIAELDVRQKILCFLGVMLVVVTWGFKMLNADLQHRAALKKTIPLAVAHEKKCKPLDAFFVLNAAKHSGMTKVTNKTQVKPAGEVCIKMSGEGNFSGVQQFIHRMGCYRLHVLGLHKRKFKAEIYGFTSLHYY